MSLPDSNHPDETKRGAQKATPLGLAGFLEAKSDCMATGVVCNPSIMIEHRFEIQDMRVRPHQEEQAWSLHPHTLGSHGK